jgi:hypothetical protein
VSLGVRHDEAAPGRRAGGADLAAVPSAVRARPPGWRDPRLWVGLLIVALSVVGGSRLLAAADDTVAVWAVAADSGPGSTLTSADLVVRRVRFADDGDLAAYYAADATLPSDLRLVRGVGAGELLPRSAVGSAEQQAGLVQLPVAVEADHVPPAVRTGSVVDVYLLGDGRAGRPSDPGAPVLKNVTVVDAPAVDGGFGVAGGTRQLVLAVPEDAATAYFVALAAVDTPLLTVVGRG